MVADPYLSGQVMVDPYSGQVVGEPVMGEMIVPGGQPSTTIQPDDFSARKFDSDGNQILWEEPLPSGATSL